MPPARPRWGPGTPAAHLRVTRRFRCPWPGCSVSSLSFPPGRGWRGLSAGGEGGSEDTRRAAGVNHFLAWACAIPHPPPPAALWSPPTHLSLDFRGWKGPQRPPGDTLWVDREPEASPIRGRRLTQGHRASGSGWPASGAQGPLTPGQPSRLPVLYPEWQRAGRPQVEAEAGAEEQPARGRAGSGLGPQRARLVPFRPRRRHISPSPLPRFADSGTGNCSGPNAGTCPCFLSSFRVPVYSTPWARSSKPVTSHLCHHPSASHHRPAGRCGRPLAGPLRFFGR